MTARRVLLMGVLNVTPDSFFDGGRYVGAAAAIAHGVRLAEEGADIVDIGGESTRPGADDVSCEAELERVIPALEGLRARVGCALSIDTRKPDVARAAIAAGARIWNDVSALTFSQGSLDAAAALGCDVVLMHAQGPPKTMQIDPRYDDVVGEVLAFLEGRIAVCEAAGVPRARLIADPGLGFGKTLAHNLALLAGLARFRELGVRLLVGASRKRFIAALDRSENAAEAPPLERLGGSIAAALAAARAGAAILRVHDVAATRQALAIAAAIEKAETAR